MTITYVQAFPPKWIIINNEGTTAGGAQLFTYDSLTRLPRATYQDPAGLVPFTNPIIFDLNGTKGPIYWQVDTADPKGYYIEAFDADGNLLWTEDNFPGVAAGGGSDVTTYLPLKNYITNNQFINHIAPISTPTNITNTVIAPSNHKGFTPALVNPIIGTYGAVGPDIRFVKNNTSLSSDEITFPEFDLSDAPLTGDVTPVEYIRYVCSTSPAGEVYKNFQFPITQKVKNLSNQAMTFTLWAAVTASPVTLDIYLRQYYGSGSAATPDTRTLIGTCALTTTWTAFNIQFTVPSVSGNSIGTPGLQTDDDAVYIQIEMPLGNPADVLFIKPCLFLGTIDPDIEFDSYDQIDSIDSTPRTGDIRLSYTTAPPQGWLAMNDTTIGNTGSGATTTGSYIFGLYKTLWDGISNTYAPVSTGRGGSAQADFLANKTLTLARSLGRALAAAGSGSGLTPTVLGQYQGAESVPVALIAANIPQHTHTYGGIVGGIGVGTGTGLATSVQNTGPGNQIGGTPLTTPPTAFNVAIIQPTSYLNVFIKL